ncbi:flagellar protein essential for flagellar pocket biogenesis [Diplonema papillatum]|nr:flagellar protein essential for flagellar pocket biogenesis [Diplonema papillatum]
MVFTVLTAADVHATKLNFELDFAAQPPLAEFEGRVTAVFAHEASLRRPPGVPNAPFQIHRMQVFDDRTEQWNDLTAGTQLVDYCQVYVFQKESAWHREVQSKIPPAVKAPALSAPPARPEPPFPGPPPPPGAGFAHPPPGVLVAAAAAPPPFPPLPASVPAGPPTYANLPAASVPGPLSVHAAQGSALMHASHAAEAAMAREVANAEMEALSATVAMRGAAAGLPLQLPLDPGAEVPFDQKVKVVFDSLGTPPSLSAFTAACERVRIDLPHDTTAVLFHKADANQDGLLSLQEFVRFGETYPTLLDSMFYRYSDHVIDVTQQQAINAAKRMIAQLRDRESEARVAAVQAQRETEEQGHRLRQQAAEVMACEQREADANAVLHAAQAEVHRCAQELAHARAELMHARENEQLKQAVLVDHQRVSEGVQLKVRAYEADCQRAEGRLKEIERLLMDQQREVERQRECCMQARTELITVQAAEQQAADGVRDAEIATRLTADALSQLEGVMGVSQQRESECHALLRAAKEELLRSVADRDREERELALAREREELRAHAEREAAKACDLQQEHAQRLEHENLEHNVRRRQAEDKERPLLEQEVRLRLQRETLEAEEARLRTEHKQFHSATGRTFANVAAMTAAMQQQPPREHLIAMSTAPSYHAASAARHHAASLSHLHGSPGRTGSHMYPPPLSASPIPLPHATPIRSRSETPFHATYSPSVQLP